MNLLKKGETQKMKNSANQMNKQIIVLTALVMLSLSFATLFAQVKTPGDYYNEMQRKLASGWNTWNTRSVLSHVYLPGSYTVNLELNDSKSGGILKEALIGRRGKDVENVTPGPHSYNGSYTELTVNWKNIEVNVKTAAEGKNLAIIVTPAKGKESGNLIINPKILWGEKGKVEVVGDGFVFRSDNNELKLYVRTNAKISLNDSTITCPLTSRIIVSTYVNKNESEIETLVNLAGKKLEETKKAYGTDSSLYDAMQSVLAWDIIYEPTNKIVISPVSRIWNTGWWNGWVLFDWDTYFASYMYSLDNRDLAYANAIAVTKNITSAGFVPNCSAGVGKSEDHSQPPVGSWVIWKIYEKYKEKWLLEEVFNELLSWNRWWESKRDVDGYLCWGSDLEYKEKMPYSLSKQIHTKQAAMWESGLDNSPMYDEAVFDSLNNKLLLADVGLMSMYVLDCQHLSKIAKELGKFEITNELDKRAEKYSKKLASLYDEKTGIFLNKNLKTGKLSNRLSPTLFYPLLTGVASQKQAERMMKEHFYNPDEFWGEWIMPSIARNDSAFKDNDYWRGRIWAPMNFLVYCCMRNYNVPDARKDMVEKSAKLILKSWNGEHHVYENNNSVTGAGDDVRNSDKFYHWGALNAFIKLLEDGKL
jgi:putative isomerase